MNTKPKLSPRPNELIPEVSAQPVWMTEYSKSALTDHANQANIDWKKTTVIDREQDRPTRIKEAVRIRKEGHWAMNRDEGNYQLSHAYDHLLDATADRRIKTRPVQASSDKDLVMRSKRQNKV